MRFFSYATMTYKHFRKKILRKNIFKNQCKENDT